MRASQPPESSRSNRALLRSVQSAEADRHVAWKEFLDRFTPLILKIAWQFASDRDAAMETYLYVCERLAADDFAKLRTYDPSQDGEPTKVSTWLTVVVRNLCVDHHRQTEGQRRYPDAVTERSALDQKVFELYYWEGRSQREIVSILETAPEYDDEAVPAALDRLRALQLRPSKTWARQTPARVDSFEEVLHSSPSSAHDGRSETDRRRWIESLLEALPPKQRLAVRWYYWTGVSASGIGQLLQVSQREVYTLLDRALRTLREKIDAPTADS